MLTATTQNGALMLSWPTNAPGFSLVCATNLAPPVELDPSLPSPGIVGGNNVVTQPRNRSEHVLSAEQTLTESAVENRRVVSSGD